MPSNLSKTPRSHKKLTLSVFDATTCALCVTPPYATSLFQFCTFLHTVNKLAQNVIYFFTRGENSKFRGFYTDWSCWFGPSLSVKNLKKEAQTLEIETDFAFWARCLGEVLLGLLWLLWKARLMQILYPSHFRREGTKGGVAPCALQTQICLH